LRNIQRFSLRGAAHELSTRASQLESVTVSEKRVGLSCDLGTHGYGLSMAPASLEAYTIEGRCCRGLSR
jgi:hypothetical protein